MRTKTALVNVQLAAFMPRTRVEKGTLLSEPPVLKKTLSVATKKKITTIFDNCVEEFHSGGAARKNKASDIMKLFEGIMREAGNKNDLEVTTEINGNQKVAFQIRSKTTGFYADFHTNSYVDKTFLFIYPGISGFEAVSIGLNGLSNGNAKQLALNLAKLLLNFQNPKVWENPGTWAEKLSYNFEFDVLTGDNAAFSRRMGYIEFAVRNFVSGLKEAEKFRVYAHTSVIPDERGVYVKHNGAEFAFLNVSYPHGEPFGQIEFSTQKKNIKWRLDNDSHVRVLVNMLFNELLSASPIKQ